MQSPGHTIMVDGKVSARDDAETSLLRAMGDPAFYPLLGYIIALNQTPQGPAFCSAVDGLKATATEDQKKISGAQLLQDNLQGFPDLTSLLSEGSAALDVVSCACQTAQWKGPGDLAGDLGEHGGDCDAG